MPYSVKNCNKLSGELTLGELFEVLTSKKRFDANKVQVFQDGKNPYVVRTSSNNGQRGFIVEDESYLNEGNTISFDKIQLQCFIKKSLILLR